MLNNLTLIQQISLAAILMLNIITYFLYFTDKKRAQTQKRHKRIPEKTLLTFTFSFGGIGALLGMLQFRHKTKHLKFKIGVPIGACLSLMSIYFILFM